MRKTLFVLFTLACLNASAQGIGDTNKSYYYYLQMFPLSYVGSKSWKAHIWMDDQEPYVICDDNNEQKKFAGAMQIVNFLSKAGWEYVSRDNINGQLHYIFRKLVQSDEDAKIGLNLLTSDDIKRKKK